MSGFGLPLPIITPGNEPDRTDLLRMLSDRATRADVEEVRGRLNALDERVVAIERALRP